MKYASKNMFLSEDLDGKNASRHERKPLMFFWRVKKVGSKPKNGGNFDLEPTGGETLDRLPVLNLIILMTIFLIYIFLIGECLLSN